MSATQKESISIQVEIPDPHGNFGMDESIGPCGGVVDSISNESVIATVHPSAVVCPHCILECSAKMSL